MCTEGDRASMEYREIMSAFWLWRLREVPEFASSVGVHDYDDRLETFTLEAFHNRKVITVMIVVMIMIKVKSRTLIIAPL